MEGTQRLALIEEGVKAYGSDLKRMVREELRRGGDGRSQDKDPWKEN